MNWFDKLLPPKLKAGGTGEKRGVPEGLWRKCPNCEAVLYRVELERNLYVCPKCNHHHRLPGRKRLDSFLDAENREELAHTVVPVDILKFRDTRKYRDRLNAAQKSTGEQDALIVMRGHLAGQPLVATAFDFNFIGGSMGSVVGERFVRAVNASIQDNCPLICFAASGGARMQEGLYSLMQMAKTSAALVRLAAKRIPFISVLTDPTTGGVSASLAMLGDIIIAEPNALIGFAGQRVIEQTIREKLPEGFQRSEFLLRHGALDMIVDRRHMRQEISTLLATVLKRSN